MFNGLVRNSLAIIGIGIFCQTAHAVATDKDRLVIAWENEPRTIDSRFPTDANSHYLADLQHCSLINFSKSGETIGQLAKKWSWKNEKTLEVEIQTDAKFSDGSAVTADDVKATYDFFKIENLKKPSPLAAAFKKIEKIEIPSPNKLVFTFIEVDTSYVPNLMIGILPKKMAAQEMFSTPAEYVGCGPYILKSVDASGLILERNPKYSLGPAAKVKTIEIKIVKDEMTRFSKLEKGELDIVQDGVSRDKASEIAGKYPNLKVIKRVGLNTSYLGFNMRDQTLANKQVRRAIAHAIDRDAIIKFILRSMANPAVTMLKADDPFYNKSLTPIKFDVKAAKDLLDQAGFKDPDGEGPKPRFVTSYKTTTNVTRLSIAQAIASQLLKVGIKVNVQALEWGKFKEDVEKGQVQMWSLNWVGFKDPDIYRHAFGTESFPPGGGNRGWYSNKVLDDLLKKAKETPGVADRKKIYDEVQKVVDEDLPYIFLWHEENFAVVRKNISGYELYADGRMSALTTTTKN